MFRESQQVGVYTLIRKLGQGGFGEVWLANRNHSPSEQVAIKLPRNDQIDLQAVKDEIFNWILSGKHKNILPIIECETFNNQIAIVSEYAPDGSLQDLINKKGSFSASEAVEIAVGILDGLAHLHNRKIIHRDLKPDNVLFQGNVPRLTDFGISRAMTVSSQSQTVSGTLSYMAPEAFDGKRNAQTDIWAVGVILYQLLTGNLPFPQKGMIELVGALARKELSPLPASIPSDLQTIVKKALAKELSDRYQTAAAMAKELREFSKKNSEETLIYVVPPTEPSPVINNIIPPTMPKPFVNVVPEIKSDTPFQLPQEKIEEPRPAKTFPKNLQEKIPLILLISFAVILIFIVGYSVSLNNPTGNSNIKIANTNQPANQLSNATKSVYSPTPASTSASANNENYDIPELKANVKGLKLFESGKITVSQSERKYGIQFNKLNTRFIDFELLIEYPEPVSDRNLQIDFTFYKGDSVFYSGSVREVIYGTSTSKIIVSGTGYETAGKWETANYRVDLSLASKVIASQTFKIVYTEPTLSGNWKHATWEDITISSSGNSYAGSYSASPAGSFTLNKTTDGIYSGSWKSTNGKEWGTIHKATISSDGNKITVIWSYLSPNAYTYDKKTSEWTRKN